MKIVKGRERTMATIYIGEDEKGKEQVVLRCCRRGISVTETYLTPKQATSVAVQLLHMADEVENG